MKLAIGFLPWTPLILLAGIIALGKPSAVQPSAEDAADCAAQVRRFLGLSAALGFLAFYSQSKQQSYYLLSLYPLLALLAGQLLSRFHAQYGTAEQLFAKSLLLIGAAASAALLIAPAFLEQVGWSLAAPAAFTVFAITIGISRLLREGRAAAACLLMLPAVGMGCAGWSCYSASVAQQEILYREAPRAKAALAAAGPDARVYGIGPSEALFIFYMERPVHTLRELADESEPSVGLAAPRRILLATEDGLRRSELADQFPECPSNALAVLDLPRNVDWPRTVASRMQSHPVAVSRRN